MMMKIPHRYSTYVFAFFMSAIMALLMCTIIVAANSGIGPGYGQRIVHAYSLAMPSAFVCILIVRPIVAKLMSLVVMPH